MDAMCSSTNALSNGSKFLYMFCFVNSLEKYYLGVQNYILSTNISECNP
jgi:hypothetical protein